MVQETTWRKAAAWQKTWSGLTANFPGWMEHVEPTAPLPIIFQKKLKKLCHISLALVTNVTDKTSKMSKELEIAFLAALEQNQQKLFRICSVYARDAEDKKDLFQEVLANIWQSMPTFKADSSLSTWMFRITLNVCLRLQSNHQKARNRFTNLDKVTMANLRAEEKNNEENQRLIKLRNCIKKLNEADKAVITLYLEELPYKEISDVMGLSENHIAVKLKRIRAKLLNCITTSP